MLTALMAAAGGLLLGWVYWGNPFRQDRHELEAWRHWAKSEGAHGWDDVDIRTRWSDDRLRLRERVDAWRQWAGADEHDPDDDTGDEVLMAAAGQAIDPDDHTGRFIRSAIRRVRGR